MIKKMNEIIELIVKLAQSEDKVSPENTRQPVKRKRKCSIGKKWMIYRLLPNFPISLLPDFTPIPSLRIYKDS